MLEEAGSGGTGADLGIRSSASDGQTVVLDKGKTVFDIVAAPEGDGQSAQASLGQPAG